MFIPTASGTFAVGGGYYLRNYVVILLIGCFFSTSFAGEIYAKIRQKKAVKIALMVLLFAVSVAYLVDSTFNPFLYFRF
jgi:alginate O-acetyltransferase complex protein AlgI